MRSFRLDNMAARWRRRRGAAARRCLTPVTTAPLLASASSRCTAFALRALPAISYSVLLLYRFPPGHSLGKTNPYEQQECCLLSAPSLGHVIKHLVPQSMIHPIHQVMSPHMPWLLLTYAVRTRLSY